MRSYPRNSPQAAARIVSLAMLADGRLDPAELDALERQRAFEDLGLSAREMRAVMHAFCEDLASAAQPSWTEACHVDQRTLAKLLAEIDDPRLRRTVLRLCVSVVEADEQIDEGESIVLVAAVEHWGLHRDMLLAKLQPALSKNG